MSYASCIFSDYKDIYKYKSKNYKNNTYVPIFSDFKMYPSLLLNDPQFELENFVILDEIMIDQFEVEYNDDPI